MMCKSKKILQVCTVAMLVMAGCKKTPTDDSLSLSNAVAQKITASRCRNMDPISLTADMPSAQVEKFSILAKNLSQGQTISYGVRICSSSSISYKDKTAATSDFLHLKLTSTDSVELGIGFGSVKANQFQGALVYEPATQNIDSLPYEHADGIGVVVDAARKEYAVALVAEPLATQLTQTDNVNTLSATRVVKIAGKACRIAIPLGAILLLTFDADPKLPYSIPPTAEECKKMEEEAGLCKKLASKSSPEGKVICEFVEKNIIRDVICPAVLEAVNEQTSEKFPEFNTCKRSTRKNPSLFSTCLNNNVEAFCGLLEKIPTKKST